MLPSCCVLTGRLQLVGIRIVKEEGVGGLFTGAAPTVVRAMALNMGMLASNDQVCIAMLCLCMPAPSRRQSSVWCLSCSLAGDLLSADLHIA